MRSFHEQEYNPNPGWVTRHALRVTAILYLCCTILSIASTVQAEDLAPIASMKALMASGKAAEAYALAQQHPDEFGQPEFDYIFALAAIDHGKYSQGIFALERYLLQKPEDPSAHLELARACFLAGNDVRAKLEFTHALQLNPPPEVQEKIASYLEAIQARARRYEKGRSWWVEGGLGYDSNLNGGVDNSQIVLPLLGSLDMLADGLKKRSSFASVNLGGEFSQPIRPDWLWLLNGQLDSRFYTEEPQFNQQNVSAATGFAYWGSQEMVKVLASTQALYLDDSYYRSVFGVQGEWRHRLDQQRNFFAGVQLARLAYLEEEAVRDANLVWGTLGYRQAWNHSWQPTLSLLASLGREKNRKNRDDLGRDIQGLGAEFSFVPQEKWLLAATITYQKNDYQAPDPILGITRKDDFYSAGLNATFQWDRAWSLRGELNQVRNDSNLALYDYQRYQTQIKVRYEWR